MRVADMTAAPLSIPRRVLSDTRLAELRTAAEISMTRLSSSQEPRGTPERSLRYSAAYRVKPFVEAVTQKLLDVTVAVPILWSPAHRQGIASGHTDEDRPAASSLTDYRLFLVLDHRRDHPPTWRTALLLGPGEAWADANASRTARHVCLLVYYREVAAGLLETMEA